MENREIVLHQIDEKVRELEQKREKLTETIKKREKVLTQRIQSLLFTRREFEEEEKKQD